MRLLIAMQDVQQLHERKQFWWLNEKNLMIFLFENLNSQLMKVIDFKKRNFWIDQNSFRSIIRN